jgi:glutathionyl-hydroquinone reductase
MGQLVDGRWRNDWYDTESAGGRFERPASRFRHFVTADGSPGPTGEGGFRAEPGRYHLYVSLACPWAHRTLIMRVLKGLEDLIDVSVVSPLMGAHGWVFDTDFPGATGDRMHGFGRLYELYLATDFHYSGRATVPVLWDAHGRTIVNNESGDIMRMLNSAFDGLGAARSDFYPRRLRTTIDAINACVYSRVNNGVYKAGFATRQDAYTAAARALFGELDALEQRLSAQRYLVGDAITEADWRLFTTLVRFDPVYHTHFKCNLRRIADYPNLSNYLRDLYQVSGVATTVNLEHIVNHYYRSHPTINPSGIVPIGPRVDYARAHDRHRFARADRVAS